jgi:hypothetical protein
MLWLRRLQPKALMTYFLRDLVPAFNSRLINQLVLGNYGFSLKLSKSSLTRSNLGEAATPSHETANFVQNGPDP